MTYYYVMEITEVISRNVRKYRAAAGLTQKRLSEICGVTLQQIQDIEGGRRKPSVDLVFRMAGALDVDSGKILEQQDTPVIERPLPFKNVLGMYAHIPQDIVEDLAKLPGDGSADVWDNIRGAIDEEKEHQEKLREANKKA